MNISKKYYFPQRQTVCTKPEAQETSVDILKKKKDTGSQRAHEDVSVTWTGRKSRAGGQGYGSSLQRTTFSFLSPSCLGLTSQGPLALCLWPLLPSGRSSWGLVSPELSMRTCTGLSRRKASPQRPMPLEIDSLLEESGNLMRWQEHYYQCKNSALIKTIFKLLNYLIVIKFLLNSHDQKLTITNSVSGKLSRARQRFET